MTAKASSRDLPLHVRVLLREQLREVDDVGETGLEVALHGYWFGPAVRGKTGIVGHLRGRRNGAFL